MTGRRDLENRLGAIGAARPPAGLVERIKSEIPRDLASATDGDRLRLRRGMAVSLRVAAVIIALVLLIWLAFAVLDIREHEERPHNPPTRGSAGGVSAALRPGSSAAGAASSGSRPAAEGAARPLTGAMKPAG
jgi:hypothetical protein